MVHLSGFSGGQDSGTKLSTHFVPSGMTTSHIHGSSGRVAHD
jgi:hypothetical protein